MTRVTRFRQQYLYNQRMTDPKKTDSYYDERSHFDSTAEAPSANAYCGRRPQFTSASAPHEDIDGSHGVEPEFSDASKEQRIPLAPGSNVKNECVAAGSEK